MKLNINGQEFDLDPSTTKQMVKLMEATERDGNERGFNLCQPESRVIIPGAICKGSGCSVLLRGCKGTGKQVGSFHTHPVVTEEPIKFDDLLASLRAAVYWRGRDYKTYQVDRRSTEPHRYLDCVGNLTDGITCRAIKDLPPDLVFGMNLEGIEGLSTEEDDEKMKSYFTDETHIKTEEIKRT